MLAGGRIETSTWCVCGVASDDFPYTVIDHKFMVSGHSYLPNDRDCSGVESARRRQPQIFIPEHWYRLVEKARRTNPFTVVRMSASDFVSVNRENITNRKTDADGNKVEWLKMRWVYTCGERQTLPIGGKRCKDMFECFPHVLLHMRQVDGMASLL